MRRNHSHMDIAAVKRQINAPSAGDKLLSESEREEKVLAMQEVHLSCVPGQETKKQGKCTAHKKTRELRFYKITHK